MSLIWCTLRTFLRFYDNPHGKDEMDQCLNNWKWGNPVICLTPFIRGVTKDRFIRGVTKYRFSPCSGEREGWSGSGFIRTDQEVVKHVSCGVGRQTVRQLDMRHNIRRESRGILVDLY